MFCNSLSVPSSWVKQSDVLGLPFSLFFKGQACIVHCLTIEALTNRLFQNIGDQPPVNTANIPEV
jgi:hypothetical protein